MARILRSNAVAIDDCARALSEGRAIAYPTETVYGLGVDATNREAVRRLFQIKKREVGKPVSVALANVESAKRFAVFNENAEALATRFLPGPLTLVLKAISPIPMITSDNKIGIRVPSNSFSQELLPRFGKPITATSANISGQESVTRAADLDRSLLDLLEIVVDSNESRYGQGSTVVDASGEAPVILREGAISRTALESAWK